MPDPPLPVCVIIPAYNRAHELPRCLASVWAQRPALPLEVIVVDDGSDDDTGQVAERYGARVVRHPHNRGLPAARNTGLESTACEWVAFLDSDDRWLPHHLARLWDLKDGHVLAGAAALRCGADPNRDRFHGTVTTQPLVLTSPRLLASTYNAFTVSGVMLRRSAALSLGGFRPLLSEDLDMWVRLLERPENTALCSPCVSVIYAIHDNQMSSDGHRMLDSHRAIVEDHCRRTGGPWSLVERWAGVAAWDSMRLALTRGERAEALRMGLRLFRSPYRLLGLGKLLRVRFSLSRRSRVARDGEPTVAVLVSNERRRREITADVTSPAVRDLSGLSALGRIFALLRRPAGLVIVESYGYARFLRLLRIRALAAKRPSG